MAALPLAVTGWILVGMTGVACMVLFVVGFVVPRWSQKAEQDVHDALDKAQEKGSKAPGRASKWVAKSLGTSRKATGKSADAGRKSRTRMPF